jgi:hypothetical protein
MTDQTQFLKSHRVKHIGKLAQDDTFPPVDTSARASGRATPPVGEGYLHMKEWICEKKKN